MAYLSKTAIAAYQQDGFLVVPQFLSEEEIDKLSNNAAKIIHDFELDEVKIFTTDDQVSVLDKYFLDSASKNSCFFEENAFDEKGQLKVAKELAINKIGHAMHDLEPDCEQIAYSKKMLETVQAVGLDNPIIVQSQYIFKQPKIGAKVNPHTDSTFIYTQPLTCLAAWIAMEDATISNGCLSIIPGSHQRYPLQEKYLKNETDTGTYFEDTSHPRMDWDLDELQPVEVKKGDLILMSGEVVHASYANSSDKSRHAFVLHFVDKSAQWSDRNWLQRNSDFPFREMVEVVGFQ